ncbi:MAG: methylated-DNA--[protein]-cysteine S-methyltransferase [Candidatus Cryptobacteroides sp.]
MKQSAFATAEYISPLGRILVSASGNGITGLWFEGQKYFASGLRMDSSEFINAEDNKLIHDCFRWLDIYFSGAVPDFTPPLDIRGTDFRRKVWNTLLKVEYGRTVSYMDIAMEIQGSGQAQGVLCRAVGNAVSHNPISLIIPCHRVIGSDGSLTGYAGGLDRKRKLLEMERNIAKMR